MDKQLVYAYFIDLFLNRFFKLQNPTKESEESPLIELKESVRGLVE